MTALTIIQDVCSRTGITAPLVVFTSTDDQIIQLRNLLNQEGPELAAGAGTDHQWTKLITEKTFSTTAAAVQTSAVPSDFGSYINETMWNRTTVQPINGPLSAAEWQTIQAQTAVSIYPQFRFRGGDILITPTPTAAQTVAYEYVSINWCESSTGTDASTMTADSDVALLDEKLLALGVHWRFLKAKGLDYAEEFRTYQMEVGKAAAKDGGRKTYRLGGPFRYRWATNIAEGSW